MSVTPIKQWLYIGEISAIISESEAFDWMHQSVVVREDIANALRTLENAIFQQLKHQRCHSGKRITRITHNISMCHLNERETLYLL